MFASACHPGCYRPGILLNKIWGLVFWGPLKTMNCGHRPHGSVGLWLGAFSGDFLGETSWETSGFSLHPEPRFRQASVLVVLPSGGFFLVQEWHSSEVLASGRYLRSALPACVVLGSIHCHQSCIISQNPRSRTLWRAHACEVNDGFVFSYILSRL